MKLKNEKDSNELEQTATEQTATEQTATEQAATEQAATEQAIAGQTVTKQTEKFSSQYDMEDESIDMENDEAFDSYEELEQKKSETNSFNVEGNQAQNQIFIQDIGSGGFTVNYYMGQMVPVTPKLPVEKKYDIRNQEECIEFVEAFKNSDFFTTAIVLSVFEAIDVTDLPDLKSKLLTLLPKEIIYNADGEERVVSQESPYTALNSILAVIGGQQFVTKEGQQCVSIGGNSLQALSNFIGQYPVLQETVIKFLFLILEEHRYHIPFYRNQMKGLFIGIFSSNMLDFKNKLLPYLYLNPQNINLLGEFVYELYKEKAEDAKKILQYWLSVDRTWLWMAACVTCVLMQQSNIVFPFDRELKKLLVKKITGYRRKDFYFLAAVLPQSKDFRIMMCGAFSYAYTHAETTGKKKTLAQAYLCLVRYGYYKVNANAMELVMVACDSGQQQKYLAPILEEIMGKYRLRKQMYAILNAYLRELSRYECSEKIIRHTAAFCYNLCAGDSDYREDIEDVLQECRCSAAKRVADLLKN